MVCGAFELTSAIAYDTNMTQDSWEKTPSSFAEIVKLAEDFVKQEIIRETAKKQLYYHTIDHAIAVKRRADVIFQAIKFTLCDRYSSSELDRLGNLIALCAISHDMVQTFVLSNKTEKPRKRIPGRSEVATANKLIEYLKNINQKLLVNKTESSILFQDEDLAIIEDAILATICDRDPQAGKVTYSFSSNSIYQPYLYNSQPKISIVGQIIALADLGTLGMDGVKPFIREGILVFLEDNLDLKELVLNCNYSNLETKETSKMRLLNMTRFIVNLAQERKARFELEIAGFCPQARQVLEEKVFVYFKQENIQKIKAIVPTDQDATFEELSHFFCLNNHF